MATSLDPFAASGGGVQLAGGQWVPKNHPLASQGGSQTSEKTTASSTMNFTPTAAPGFTAPQFGAAPTWATPQAFTYGEFQAPDQAAVLADPGYQFRLQQGTLGLNNNAAARGTIRGGGQQRALMAYGQDLASQEYQNAFNRAKGVYDTNYQRAKDVYDKNYQSALDTYKIGAGERDAQYNANYQNAVAEYNPLLQTWQAQNLAGLRNAEANFNRDWDRETYWNDDLYRKGRDASDDAYRRMVYGGDDAFRWENMREQRRQFLASLGNY